MECRRSDVMAKIVLFVCTNLVCQIVIGMILGVVVASFFPELADKTSFLGDLFVKALKSIAPILLLIPPF